MEGLRKSVKIGKTVYVVRVDDDYIEASETVYPLSGYGNNYGTSYEVDLDYSKAWAKVSISCWNSDWGTRGHGLTDSWTDSVGYVRKFEAKDFYGRITRKLQKAEDGTPDVKDVFDDVKAFVKDHTGDGYD